MVPDVLSYTLFVPAYSAHAVASRPKAAAEQSPFCFHHVAMDSNGALSLQISNRMGYAVFWWDTEQHVHMIGHRLAFQKVDSTLLTQFPKYLAYSLPYLAVEHFLAVLRNDHHMILAFPLHMCLTLRILQWRSSLPFWGLPRGDRLSFSPWTWQSLINSHRQSRWFSCFN